VIERSGRPEEQLGLSLLEVLSWCDALKRPGRHGRRILSRAGRPLARKRRLMGLWLGVGGTLGSEQDVVATAGLGLGGGQSQPQRHDADRAFCQEGRSQVRGPEVHCADTAV
jgi:hypothetical protein